MTVRTLLAMLTAVSFLSTAYAQNYRSQDTAVGGLAGAVIGGIIGHQNDETPEGALIGGAVGAIAGNLLGKAKDNQVTQQRYYQHQAMHAQQQLAARAVSLSDVVEMSRRGLSDSVIINHLRTNGIQQQIGTREIIALHESGVSEPIITAMQQSPLPGSSRHETVIVERPAPPSQTVIVERTVPRPPTVVVRKEYRYPPAQKYYAPPRVRYATRPAFPAYPSRANFHRYW